VSVHDATMTELAGPYDVALLAVSAHLKKAHARADFVLRPRTFRTQRCVGHVAAGVPSVGSAGIVKGCSK
jgi:hypothetical protein